LQITQVVVNTDSTELGKPFLLAYTVENKGNMSITGRSWRDQVYLSNSPAWSITNAIKVAENTRTQLLPASQTYTVTNQLAVNGNALPYLNFNDSLYCYVVTDGGNDIYEYNFEMNNVNRSNAIFYKYPDLKVINFSGSTALFSGQPAQVNWEVINIGGRAGNTLFNNSWNDRVYLSIDSTISADDKLLSNESITGPLNTDSFYQRSINYTVPNGASGNYYLCLIADTSNNNYDVDKSNNRKTMSGVSGNALPVTITLTPSPDLVVTTVSSPSIGYAGQPVMVKWRVKNVGIGPTKSGAWVDRIYISNSGDSTRSAAFAQLGTHTRIGNLVVGEFYDDSMQVFLPINSSGNFYVKVDGDFLNVEYEHNKENNNAGSSAIFIIKPLPSDLVASDVTLPEQVIAGDSITIRWKVKNIGTNTAVGYFTQGVYLSSDSSWNVTDALLANPQHYNVYIPPLGELDDSIRVKVKGVRAGKFYAIVRADLTNNIIETDENNNTGISIDTIGISFPQLPIDVLTPATLNLKSELYYRLDIPDSLQGETMLISLKSDSLLAPNELYIKYGDVPRRSSFDYAFDRANSGNQDIVIPAVSAGTYYILGYNASSGYTQSIRLLAKVIKFSIISVATNEGGNTGNVTVKIKGAKFEPNMQVNLFNSSAGSIYASNVQFVNSTTIFATFNLSGKSIGSYNLIATKINNDTTSLPNGFRILAGLGGGFQGGGATTGGFYCSVKNIGVDQLLGFDLQYPASVRGGRQFTMEINFGNSGNVDIPVPSRILISVLGYPVSLTPGGLSNNKSDLYLEFSEVNGPQGILRPGATGSITIYTSVPNVSVFSAYRLIE